MLCDAQKPPDNSGILRSAHNQKQPDKEDKKAPVHFFVQFSRLQSSGNQ